MWHKAVANSKNCNNNYSNCKTPRIWNYLYYDFFRRNCNLKIKKSLKILIFLYHDVSLFEGILIHKRWEASKYSFYDWNIMPGWISNILFTVWFYPFWYCKLFKRFETLPMTLWNHKHNRFWHFQMFARDYLVHPVPQLLTTQVNIVYLCPSYPAGV